MSISLHAPVVSGKALFFWRMAQALGIVATVMLIVGFFVRPNLALPVLWNVLIPILPATFLIAPALWRGLCPLATLNMLPNGLLARRSLSTRALPSVGGVGMGLLMVLVPARRFLFNEHGIPLAVVVIAVAVAALALGAVFDFKAGFCNALCPVLPVEKLYGQHPFVKLRNPRCAHCVLCTPKGCLDLAPTKSAIQAVGAARQSAAWLKTGYGIFAAAFPGFVVGYFTTADGPLATAPSVYLTVGLWAGGSYLLVALIAGLLKVRAVAALPVLAAAAVGLYYWFVAPTVAATLGVAPVGTVIIQGAALALVGVWLWRAMRRVRSPNGSSTVSRAQPLVHR